MPLLSAVTSIVGVFGPWPAGIGKVELGWVLVVVMLVPAVLWGTAAITGIRSMGLHQEKSWFTDPDQPLVATARMTWVVGIGALALTGLFWLIADSGTGWGLWAVTIGVVG